MAAPEDGQRRIGDWIVGQLLGSGSFAVVWRARHRATGQPAAIKEINLTRLNARLRQSLESEVAILKRMSHPNVVRLFEVLEAHGRLFIVMEYCAGGDLAQLIKGRGRLAEPVVRRLMTDLAAGLRELWTNHLVHRDLKPQNLLLATPFEASDDPNTPPPALKIADFGFARALGPQLLAETLCGSPLYMAPEILLSQRYDAKADLWSVGAILYEALAGAPPYTGANQVALLRAIRDREARLPPAVAAELSPPCRALIHALLRRNAVERIAFEDFFSHPFFTGSTGNTGGGVGGDRGDVLLGEGGAGGTREPQHIVGFNGAGGSTVSPAAAAPLPAAVPVSQLTEQFRPRLVSMRRPVQEPAVPVQRQTPSCDGDSGADTGDEGFVIISSSEIVSAAEPPPGATPPAQDAAAVTARRGATHEAFLLPHGADGGGADPALHTLEGSVADTVPWQAAGRCQFLRLMAGILEDLGAEAAPPPPAAAATASSASKLSGESVATGSAASSGSAGRGSAAVRAAALSCQLSFYLAALQLYEAVLGAGDEGDKGPQLRHSMHSSMGSADSAGGDAEAVRAAATAALRRADAAAAELKAKAPSHGEPELPNPWRAAHEAALRWAEEAAAEELLGNYGRSEGLYCRSGMILHFLAAEAAILPCQPAPQIAPADEARLRLCASAAAARWAVCSALARREAAVGLV